MTNNRKATDKRRLDWGEVEEETRRVHHGEVPEFRPIDMELLWKCLSCGFLFPRDAEPPTECPGCGAAETEFEAVVED